MRFEYIKAFRDDFVVWSLIITDADSVEQFKADFEKYYGYLGDYIIAWRVAGSDEEHIERPEMMVGKAKDALEFFFHNDIEAARRFLGR